VARPTRAGRAALLLLAGAALLAPRHAAAEASGPPRIVSIEADAIPGLDTRATSGLAVGATLDRTAARAAIHALWATGRVTDVRVLSRPVPGGVAVTIDLDLEQVVRGLEVAWRDEGEEPLERQEIARAVGYYAGMPWQPDALDEMVAALREAFERRGYPTPEVEGAVVPSESDPEAVSLRLTLAAGEPVRVAAVELRGRLGRDEDEVRRALDIAAGDVYDRVRLEAGVTAVLARLRAAGHLEARGDVAAVVARPTAGPDGRREVRLTVPIEAGDRYIVDFVGNAYFTHEELLEVVGLADETELTRAILDTLAQRLRDHHARHGFYFARADWRVTPRRPGERRLAFRIRRGPRVTVTDIAIEGNAHFTDRHIRRQIVAQLQERLGERGLFRGVGDDEVSDIGVAGEVREPWRPGPRGRPRLRVRPREVYVAEVYDEALTHVRNLYAADGYLDARLAAPELAFSPDRSRLGVTIRVEEGPQTRIRSLSFAGNAELDDERIRQVVELDVGSPLARYDVEQDRRRITRAYHDAGYVFAAVLSSETVDEDRLAADVRYDIEEGPRIRVGEVLVRGNDLTRTSLIRDRILLRPGQIFTPQAASRSERALIDLGIFSTVSITLVEPDLVEPIKDIVVEVAERAPQRLEGRVGFSTADGPRGGLRYGYYNLFGSALGVELRVQLSYQVFFLGTPEFEEFVTSLSLADRLERLIVLSLRVPHIPRVGNALDLRLDATHERDNDPAYAVTRYGLTLSASSGYRPYFSAQLQTGFNFSDIEQVQELPDCLALEPEERQPGANCLWTNVRSTQLARAPQGTAWFWVTRLGLSLDLRDSPFNPTRGFFGSLSAEHVYSLVPTVETFVNDPADPGDDEVFARESNLIKFALTLNGYVPLGFLDIVLALSVRFGWIFELTGDSYTFPDRFFYLGGFDSMRGFPEESMWAQDWAEPGGNSMLNFRAELRIPLPSSFALGVFADMGNIWREQVNLWREFELRYCVGAGIRFNTPVGPLALDGAFVVNRTAGYEEAIGAIQFAIGLF
jgi:outer membrane protein assembly complex protein YaeT